MNIERGEPTEDGTYLIYHKWEHGGYTFRHALVNWKHGVFTYNGGHSVTLPVLGWIGPLPDLPPEWLVALKKEVDVEDLL